MILDVLFYEQEAHRKRIQSAVIRRISELVAAWRRHNPTFDADGGKVVLLSHSLGALILFDLLVARKLVEPLGCRPAAFVALGSPLGCFLSLRGVRLGRSFGFHDCDRFYNLFHPNDPVGGWLASLI